MTAVNGPSSPPPWTFKTPEPMGAIEALEALLAHSGESSPQEAAYADIVRAELVRLRARVEELENDLSEARDQREWEL